MIAPRANLIAIATTWRLCLVVLLPATAAGCKSEQPSSGGGAQHPTPLTGGNAPGITLSPIAVTQVAAAKVQQEVLLHTAMYRAAYQSRVSGAMRSFVLEPMQEDQPPDLGIESDEFRSRVLMDLADLGAPAAWVAATWRTGGADFFPGTNEPATRLRIRTTKRNENEATVTGEVSDVTANVGSSRQGVTATWDGKQWNIERDPVRVVW